MEIRSSCLYIPFYVMCNLLEFFIILFALQHLCNLIIASQFIVLQCVSYLSKVCIIILPRVIPSSRISFLLSTREFKHHFLQELCLTYYSEWQPIHSSDSNPTYQVFRTLLATASLDPLERQYWNWVRSTRGWLLLLLGFGGRGS